jgi:hypothetical protein
LLYEEQCISHTISKTHLDDNIVVEGNNSDSSDDSNVIETTDDPEMIVRDLEARNLRRLQMRKLSPQARQILLFTASLHIREGRGLTVEDLEKLGFGKHNAEKIIQDARRNGLLIPGDTKKGKQKQYYLSNYKYKIDDGAKRRKDKHKEIFPVDKDITLQLLQLLSNRKYIYHNIHLETNLCYNEDYNHIEWNIPSSYNKQKVMAFKLELNRKCSIIVSEKGTINISIECTFDPYEFHTPSGLIEFIGSCGQVLNVLQAAASNKLYIVPSIPDWYITQFDYNKDIPTNNAGPTVLSWAPAYGRLKVGHLGTIFQIYPKGLPDLGDCLRFEGHYSTKEKKNLKDTLSDIIEWDNGHGDYGGIAVGGGDKKGKRSPFVTAEDLLKKVKENVETDDENRISDD